MKPPSPKKYPINLRLLCIFLIPLSVVRSARPVIPFIRTHWLFSYEFGFLKRGLPGELLRQLSMTTNEHRIDAIALILFLLVACALLWTFSIPARKNPGNAGAWWFLLWAGTSSATLQRFAWDSGRYDGIGILLMLSGIYISQKLKGSLPALVINTLLGVLMLLIHEGQLLMFIPMMLFFWFNSSESQPMKTSAFDVQCSMFDVRCLISAFLFLSLIAIYISQTGILPDMSHSDHIAHLKHIDPQADPIAAHIPLRDLADNQAYTLSLSFRNTVLPHHLLFLLGSAPLLYLWFNRLKHSGFNVRRLMFSVRFLTFLASLSPLALYLLGVDHFRWWALAFCNLFILESLFSHEEQYANKLTSFCENHKIGIIIAVLFAFLLGSFGDTDSFALIKYFSGLRR